MFDAAALAGGLAPDPAAMMQELAAGDAEFTAIGPVVPTDELIRLPEPEHPRAGADGAEDVPPVQAAGERERDRGDRPAGLRLQLDLGEAGSRLRKRSLRGECECPGQRDERRDAEAAAGPRAAKVHVRRCSGHSRISLQIIRSARVRRGAR